MKREDRTGSRHLRRRHRRNTFVTRRTLGERWFHPRLEALERRYLLSTVVGNFLFYNGSSFDTGPGAAIATDKTPYDPNGTTAVFANASSYTKGINGLIIDLQGAGDHASITAADFVFKVGNNNASGSWVAAPAPNPITIYGGAGVSGSDRVEITWADNAIKNEWLEVQVLPTSNTGLSSTEIFLWGNKVGDSTADFITAVPDAGFVFTNFGVATITNLYDYDRSGVVAVPDAGNVFLNLGAIASVNLTLAPPALSAGLANDTGPGGVPNADAITQDPAISGTVTPDTIPSLFAGLNGAPIATDITFAIQPGGDFTLSEPILETMNGGPLAEGGYMVTLRAMDSYGLITLLDVPFTLKRSIATPGTPDLTAASDSGTSSTDDITNDNTPTFDVTAEAGSTVTLYRNGTPVGQGPANSVAQVTASTTGDGSYTFTATAEDGAGNVSAVSGGLPATIHTAAPTVTVSTVITFGDDLTPHVTVTGASGLGLANGTQVDVDVDVNDDGDFLDTNETSRTLSTLFAGSSYFEVTPALPPTNVIDGPYLVQLRARITDIAGNEGTSPLSSLLIDTLPSTALSDYVNAADATYSVSASPVSTIAGAGYTVYVFDLKSQTWRSAADVTTPLWQHWLQIIVPSTVSHSTALLLIDGGSIGGSAPTSLNGDMVTLGSIAAAREMITVVLPTVPNEPLQFTDETLGNTRNEDEIIAYTFDKYVNNIGAGGNETWPLLLPMVKSAVKAMDAVQAKDTTLPGGTNIDEFIVTGYSKRGWTTWLTGAVDSRVTAIIPGVIDLLNMDESMVNHYGFYGFFADHVQDYQDFNIIENIVQPANQELGRIVDPYSYLFNSNLTSIPKLLLNSTGDEFFVPDSGQFYLSDLPGPSYVRYIPGTGHGLDSRAIDSTNSWTDAMLFNRTLPDYSWSVDPDGGIRMTSVTSPTTVKLWQATNSSTRDFRNSFTSLTWTSSTLSDTGGGVYLGNVATPGSGATAYVVEMTYPSALGGNPYVFTTEVRVQSNIPRTSWPFFMPTNGPGGGTVNPASAGGGSLLAVTGDDRNVVAFGLASTGVAADPSNGTPSLSISAPGSAIASLHAQDAAAAMLFDDWSWFDDDDNAADEADDVGAIDWALAGLSGDTEL